MVLCVDTDTVGPIKHKSPVYCSLWECEILSSGASLKVGSQQDSEEAFDTLTLTHHVMHKTYATSSLRPHLIAHTSWRAMNRQTCWIYESFLHLPFQTEVEAEGTSSWWIVLCSSSILADRDQYGLCSAVCSRVRCFCCSDVERLFYVLEKKLSVTSHTSACSIKSFPCLDD